METDRYVEVPSWRRIGSLGEMATRRYKESEPPPSAVRDVPGSSHAALFDMDRTLVRKNTAQLYTRYRRDLGEVGLGHSLKVAWWLLQYTSGFVDAPAIARRALAEYAGTNEAEHFERCRGWFSDYVLPHVAAAGRRAVERHRAQGDVLVLVTGSTRYAAQPLCDELGIRNLVCSKVQVDDQGAFTGEVREPLCFGQGKLERTRRFLDRNDIALADCAFYSDSVTDLPLLEAVGTAVAVNPDPRLRRFAQRRGWTIEDW